MSGAGKIEPQLNNAIIDYQEDLVGLVQKALYMDDPETNRHLDATGKQEMARLSAKVNAIASRNEDMSPEMEFYELEMQDVESKAILKFLQEGKELSNETRADFKEGVRLYRKIIKNAQASAIGRMYERARPEQKGIKRMADRPLESPPKLMKIGDFSLILSGNKRGRDEIEMVQPGRKALTLKQLKLIEHELIKVDAEDIKTEGEPDQNMVIDKINRIKKIRTSMQYRAAAREALRTNLQLTAAQQKTPKTLVELEVKRERLKRARDEVGVEDVKRGRVNIETSQEVEMSEEPPQVQSPSTPAQPLPPQPTPAPASAPASAQQSEVPPPPPAVPVENAPAPIQAHPLTRSESKKVEGSAPPPPPPPPPQPAPAGAQEGDAQKPQGAPDAMQVEGQDQPPHGGGDEPEDGGGGDQAPPPPPGEVATGVEDEGGETAGDGADGRDDLLSTDEAKTLLRDEFQWKVEDTRYLTKESRGKIGYGQGSEANVQPIQPFGTTLKESPDESRGESVFKQKDSRFEPFRGQHEIVAGEKDSKKDAGGAGEEILATAMTPFAKIGGQVIWIPFYAKAVKMYFTAQDFEELVSNVTEQRGKLKLKAPNPSVIQNMQKTVDQVRTSLRAFEVFPLKVRHENLTTRYAEWLELRQIMKAVSKYQKTTTGMYNQAGLFSGSLREAVSKAIDDAVGMVGKKQKKTLGRGLEGVGATQRGEGAHDSPAEFQAFNPFQVKESPIKKTRSTLPRFF